MFCSFNQYLPDKWFIRALDMKQSSYLKKEKGDSR